jgi:hypothetical protein
MDMDYIDYAEPKQYGSDYPPPKKVYSMYCNGCSREMEHHMIETPTHEIYTCLKCGYQCVYKKVR